MNEIERVIEAFDKEHDNGDGTVLTEDGVWICFSDGARRSRVSYGACGNELRTPTQGTPEARRWQKTFWEIRLGNLVDQFEELRFRAKTLAGDDGRFRERLEELKTLQTAVRSARSKLSHFTVLEKGYTQADVSRAWEVWQAFSEAAAEESRCSEKFQSAMLHKSGEGTLEKLKRKLDEAKRRSQQAMQKWNEFQPPQARSIVSTELDAERRRQRENELEQIEV